MALGVSAFSFPVFCLAWRESDAGTKIWLVTTRGASCVSSHGFLKKIIKKLDKYIKNKNKKI